MESIPEAQISEKLSEYRNERDRDIERFLRERAIEYERRRWASTYLLLSPADNFQSATIEAYFTLSHKAITPGDKVSNAKKKWLGNGLRNPNNLYHAVLIGQMGKRIGAGRESLLTGDQILNCAFEVVRQADKIIAARNVFLECDIHRVRLQELYVDYGFRELQRNERFVQLFCKI